MGKLRHYLLNPLNLLKLLLERSGANHHTTDAARQWTVCTSKSCGVIDDRYHYCSVYMVSRVLSYNLRSWDSVHKSPPLAQGPSSWLYLEYLWILRHNVMYRLINWLTNNLTIIMSGWLDTPGCSGLAACPDIGLSVPSPVTDSLREDWWGNSLTRVTSVTNIVPSLLIHWQSMEADYAMAVE